MLKSIFRREDSFIYVVSMVLLTVVSSLSGCIETPNKFSGIPPGMWRATLNLAGQDLGQEAFDEKNNGMLPFNFEVIYDTADSFHIELVNGEERLLVDEIYFGRDRSISKDTIRIVFPVYGSYIIARYEEDAIEGDYYVPVRGQDYKIPFRARHGKTERFTMIDPPVTDISGEWASQFEVQSPNPYPAIGKFVQEENGRVTGTFRTETGDYRYLEGKMSGDRLYLSVFDGAHAFIFEAKYFDDGTLSGVFRSGNHHKTYWTASRDSTFELKSPYELTYLKEGYETFEFAFPNLDGEIVTLSDPQYVGKPKIIQIFGTWCPNCREETGFLMDYRKNNPDKDFEIIALAFERNTSKEKAISAIRRYIDYFDIDYEILYAGTNDKAAASEKLPMLNRIISYPTLLFLDRENRVVKIHTGYNGTATDKYDAFVKEFERDLDAIING
ncbi:MAG: TlpA family protein disulfide reductase [Bacteroidetes bacterium]|nr:MAG: TlpA family protein disulfide reductase [Bacteroidota bacterium]